MEVEDAEKLIGWEKEVEKLVAQQEREKEEGRAACSSLQELKPEKVWTEECAVEGTE